MTDSSRKPGETPKIAIKGLSKAFGTKQVLDGVDLEIEAGESLVVIGGSGSGKSVLLKCILGLLEPDAGEIRVDDVVVAGDTKDSKAAKAARAKIGMLFQHAALFDSLPVWRNVAFGLLSGTRAKPAKEAKAIAVEKLQQVGMEASVGELYPAELSGGMRKRVGLARAIATDPEIIFFDEPTTGLDPIMGHVIDNLIVDCVQTLGATALTITHDMASARRISNRIAMLYRGRIVWDGPTRQVERSGNPVVDQFINGRAEGPIPTVRG